MLRFDKHILKGLYNNVQLTQSYLSLSQKSAFLFVNRRKGLNKHERAIHATAEFFERLDKRYEEKKKKRLMRKGIEEEEITPAKLFAQDMIKKMQADPEKFFSDDNIIFDQKSGLMARKEDIGDIDKFLQSEEWKGMEAIENEENQKERKKSKTQRQPKERAEKDEIKQRKEDDLSENDSEGLFDDWKNDTGREKLSEGEEGGGRKGTRHLKTSTEQKQPRKDNFKDIFRQFSTEPLEKVDEQKNINNQVKEGLFEEKYDSQKHRKNEDFNSQRNVKPLKDNRIASEEDEFELQAEKKSPKRGNIEKNMADEAKRRSDNNKKVSHSERDEANSEDDVFDDIVGDRDLKNSSDSIEEMRRKRVKDIKSDQDFFEFEESVKNNKSQQSTNKNTNSKKDEFQDVLNRFSAEPLENSQNTREFVEEEDDEFFVNIDRFDKLGDKNFNSHKNVKTNPQKTSTSKNNLQQFYSELSQEKVKKIEKTLEREEHLRDNPLVNSAVRGPNNSFEQPKRREPVTITDYDTFQKNLERKKSLERFYYFLRKFDADNLIKILSYPDLIDKNPTEQIPKFLILLNYIRKNRLLSTYNREDIYGVIEKILGHIEKLRFTEVSTLAVLLDKMRIDRAEYFRELEKRVIEDAEKFSIRTISNIIFSFGRISSKQSITEDFSELFSKMETIIALKVKNMNPKDLSQIMVGYSKSQSFSPEFLYVLEQACIEKYDMMRSQELAVISHTFAKNDHYSEEFFDRLRKSLPREAGNFRIMELALVMEAFEKFKMINQDALKELEKQFLRRGDQANIQDIAVFFKLLTRPEYRMRENALSKMKEVTDLLFNNIDATCLYKMFDNFAEKFDKGTIKKDMAEVMIRRFKILIRTNAIRGIHFTYIKAELFKVKDENIVRQSKKALQEEFSRKDSNKKDLKNQSKTPREY